jgi:hypothetical protein
VYNPTIMTSELQFNVIKWLIVAVAPFSLVADTLLLTCIYRHKERRNTVFHRLMVGMAFHDWFGSLGISLGPVPMPRQYGLPFSYGTIATCTAQGLIVNLLVVAHLYGATVPMYYLLLIRYKKNESWISKYIEPMFHALPLLWGYVAIFVGLSKTIFNPIATQNLCSVGVAPPGCDYTPDMVCTRGQSFNRFGYVFNIAPVSTTLGLLFFSLTVVIFTIRSQLRRNLLYEFHGGDFTSKTPSGSEMNAQSRTMSTRKMMSSKAFATSEPKSSHSLEGPELTNRTDLSPAEEVGGQNGHGASNEGMVVDSAPSPHARTDSDSTSQRNLAVNETIDKGSNTRLSDPVRNETNRQFSFTSSRNASMHKSSALLQQAITQCLCYGLAFLFCSVWTLTLFILDVAGHEAELFTQYYWVRFGCRDMHG